MNTADLLKSLYPPVSYDTNAPVLSALIAADASVLDDALTVVSKLLFEIFPDTCQTSLSDWERVYGLPDTCMTAVNNDGVRRAMLVAKINDKGGIRNEDYVERLKIVLGIDVTVTEFNAAQCTDPCDVPVFSEDWRYVWQVNVAQGLDVWHASCTDNCASPLDFYDNDALMCILKSHAPAGTLPIVEYVNKD